MPPAASVDEQLANQHDMRPRDAARAGYPLSLATVDSLAERIAALHTEGQRRGRRREQAGADNYRRSRGIGAPITAA